MSHGLLSEVNEDEFYTTSKRLKSIAVRCGGSATFRFR